jgi:hypothetical protein
LGKRGVTMREAFKTLNAINVNENTEKKNGLTYLSWAWAWAELKKVYPCATYKIKHFDGRPYLYDENLGYMVMTEMTVDGITHEMWLPVMDGANKAMKDKEYTMKKGKYETTVQPATMFDINTAIMRCLTKNIAMFGLGLYIYAGEDLPEDESEKAAKEAEEIRNMKISDIKVDIIKNKCKDLNITEKTILTQYDIKTIADMTEEQFLDATRRFEVEAKKRK